MTILDERRAAIRTFHPRRGRLGPRQRDALTTLWPRYGLGAGAGLGPAGRPLVLEIGSGMGEAAVAMAAADPGRDYLAVEIHTPGVANLLAMAHERQLRNLRVAVADALELMRDAIPPGRLDAIHVFFPDPWPKVRHHKRRLIQPVHVALLASRLRAGGALLCATDDAGYAAAMRTTLEAEPSLAPGPAGRPARPCTKFEQRALDAGRAIVDLRYVKRP
jgi:tRNA (guanine-N7-)-methyltransferase